MKQCSLGMRLETEDSNFLIFKTLVLICACWVQSVRKKPVSCSCLHFDCCHLVGLLDHEDDLTQCQRWHWTACQSVLGKENVPVKSNRNLLGHDIWPVESHCESWVV